MIETISRGRGGLQGRVNPPRQYRSAKRIRRYAFRLVERSFCLDINFLSKKGFFRSGRYISWEYDCETAQEGYRGHAILTWTNSSFPDEHAIRVESPLLPEPVVLRVVYKPHPLYRWAHWFRCPKCRRFAACLSVPLGTSFLACRVCHRLCYWSQMRGKRRIGAERYQEQQKLYKLRKKLVKL